MRPINEMMQRSVAAIMPAILIPSQAPLEKASRRLAGLSSVSSGMMTRPAVRVSSSSGQRSLEHARDAGILITQDEIRACALTPMER